MIRRNLILAVVFSLFGHHLMDAVMADGEYQTPTENDVVAGGGLIELKINVPTTWPDPNPNNPDMVIDIASTYMTLRDKNFLPVFKIPVVTEVDPNDSNTIIIKNDPADAREYPDDHAGKEAFTLYLQIYYMDHTAISHPVYFECPIEVDAD